MDDPYSSNLNLKKYEIDCEKCKGRGCIFCHGTGKIIVWRNRYGKICFKN